MILVDTSIWIEHLRDNNTTLLQLLNNRLVLAHPFIVGELALGTLRQREVFLDMLRLLPQATVASHAEVMHFIDHHRLFGSGIGYVDAHLLAATRLATNAGFWTRDKSLRNMADRLHLTAENLP